MSPAPEMDESEQSASNGDISPVSGDNLILMDLLHKSGTANFRPRKLAGMSENRFIELSTKMAPIESDGPDDEDEWNLFDKCTL